MYVNYSFPRSLLRYFQVFNAPSLQFFQQLSDIELGTAIFLWRGGGIHLFIRYLLTTLFSDTKIEMHGRIDTALPIFLTAEHRMTRKANE